MVRFLLLAFAALALSCAPLVAAAQTATPRINPLTGKPYSAASQAEYERRQRENEELSRMAEEATAQDNKAFEEMRARNAEQIRQFDEAIETWKENATPPPGTTETFVSTSYDNDTALGERAEITYYNKYDVPTHKVQFGPDGKPTGPVTLTQQGKVWETIGPRIPPGGGVETSYGEDFEGNRIITRARIFDADGKNLGDYKFNFDGVPWWGETRDPETGLRNGGFMDERLKPPEATVGGPLAEPAQVRLVTGVCTACRALGDEHNDLAARINAIAIEMKSLSAQHQHAWPPAQRPIRARHEVLAAELAQLMPRFEALRARVVECEKRCRAAEDTAREETLAARPDRPAPQGPGSPATSETAFTPGQSAFPADNSDLQAVIDAAQAYFAAANCEGMECPVCDCDKAREALQALSDMEHYLRAMEPYMRAANDAHMARLVSVAENNITNGEQRRKTVWAIGVHQFLHGFGSTLLDTASISSWVKDGLTGKSLDEMSPAELIDKLDSWYEAAKSLESGLSTLAEAQAGKAQDTPIGDLVDVAGGVDKALINDTTSTITDAKSIIKSALENGKDWRKALKEGGAAAALGQIAGRYLKAWSASRLKERQDALGDLLADADAGDLMQGQAFIELQKVQARRAMMEDALAAVTAAKAAYMHCAWRACGPFTMTRPQIPSFVQDVPGGTPILSWGRALPWFNAAIAATTPRLKPVTFREGDCPKEKADDPRTAGTPQGDAPPLSRPQFERLPDLTLPASFCSETERVRFMTEVYNPAVAAALSNASIAQDHQAKLNALFTETMRANSPHWAAVRAERDAFEPIGTETTARAEALRRLYSAILAVPIVPCPEDTIRTASGPGQDEPPTEAVAVSSPTTTRPRSPKEDCPPKQGRDPITVGPNSRVGSGAQLRSKVGGMALGALAGALGAGGGGGGGGSDGPQLWTCKIKDSEYTVFNDPVTGVSLGVAARSVKGGKMVLFSKIMKSPDKGTFQTAFLERPSTGQTIAPSDIGPCDLWGEWKLTVSWTKSTYVDGQLVSQESGGWSEGGLFRIPGMLSKVDAPDGLWKRMGFSNASNGAREMGAIFDVQPTGEPLTLVVHVTRPKGDPVTTVPFILTLSQGADGKIAVTKAEEALCPEEKARASTITISNDPAPAAGATTTRPADALSAGGPTSTGGLATPSGPATATRPTGSEAVETGESNAETSSANEPLPQIPISRLSFAEEARESAKAKTRAKRMALNDARCMGPEEWEKRRQAVIKWHRGLLEGLRRVRSSGPDAAAIDSIVLGESVRVAEEIRDLEALPPPPAPDTCPSDDFESILDEIDEVFVPA
ncbi:MAG: hypothetical protein Q8J89_03030 [Caulobacter sp.]|nr:hypothetical protein [Caulobacter sp.]